MKRIRAFLVERYYSLVVQHRAVLFVPQVPSSACGSHQCRL